MSASPKVRASVGLLVTALFLGACGKTTSHLESKTSEPAAIAAATPPPTAEMTPTTPNASAGKASASSTYVPPSAAELIRLLAPIAPFPDQLVAQVLAASTYPDQVAAANDWIRLQSNLKDGALQTALEDQPWDPSIKALVPFPDILRQMASNADWMKALGEAYQNDPRDVMNAIQSLRSQALACGHLKSNNFLKVSDHPRLATGGTESTGPSPELLDFLGNDLDPIDDDAPPIYSGPPVIPATDRIIEIAPAESDIVYVPRFDPVVFYGVPFALYPGYSYAPPIAVYGGPGFGAWGFGFGVSVRFAFGHPWAWGGWGLRWGPAFAYAHYGINRPGVVLNNRIYVSCSTTIVNHFANPWRPQSSPIDTSRPTLPRSVTTGADRTVARTTASHVMPSLSTPSGRLNNLSLPTFKGNLASGNAGSKAPSTSKQANAAPSVQPRAAAMTQHSESNRSQATSPGKPASIASSRSFASVPVRSNTPSVSRPAPAIPARAHTMSGREAQPRALAASSALRRTLAIRAAPTHPHGNDTSHPAHAVHAAATHVASHSPPSHASHVAVGRPSPSRSR